MTQLVKKELRLVSVIQEGRDLLAEFRKAQDAAAKMLKDMPKSAKTEKQALMDIMQKAATLTTDLRRELHEASEVARHIDAHYLWKNAIEAVFGKEGLDKCIIWMDYERENRREAEAYLQEERINIG